MCFSHAMGHMLILYVSCMKFPRNRFVGNLCLTGSPSPLVFFANKKEKRKTLVWELLHPSQFTNPSLSLSLSDQWLSTCVTVLPQVALPKLFCAQRSSRSLPRLPPWPSTNIYIFFNLINYFFQENWGALTPPLSVVASENMTIIKSKTIRRMTSFLYVLLNVMWLKLLLDQNLIMIVSNSMVNLKDTWDLEEHNEDSSPNLLITFNYSIINYPFVPF
jgi:hypothetical protein